MPIYHSSLHLQMWFHTISTVSRTCPPKQIRVRPHLSRCPEKTNSCLPNNTHTATGID
jgi:hypothetical protein